MIPKTAISLRAWEACAGVKARGGISPGPGRVTRVRQAGAGLERRRREVGADSGDFLGFSQASLCVAGPRAGIGCAAAALAKSLLRLLAHHVKEIRIQLKLVHGET